MEGMRKGDRWRWSLAWVHVRRNGVKNNVPYIKVVLCAVRNLLPSLSLTPVISPLNERIFQMDGRKKRQKAREHKSVVKTSQNQYTNTQSRFTSFFSLTSKRGRRSCVGRHMRVHVGNARHTLISRLCVAFPPSLFSFERSFFMKGKRVEMAQLTAWKSGIDRKKVMKPPAPMILISGMK